MRRNGLAGVLPVLFVLFATTSPAIAQPRVVRDGGREAVVGLSTDTGCVRMNLSGRVAAREFGPGGLYLSSVVVETASGERSLVNVDDGYKDADAASQGSIKRAIETLLNVGKPVALRVKACGAAGRTLMLDTVRPR